MFLIFCNIVNLRWRLIVQLVEHTAHNGTDVGSNPAKPKQNLYKMQLNLKSYQINKTKQYLKEKSFVFFSIGANQNAQNWIETEQGLNRLKLNYHKTYNNIAIKIARNSIYKNSSNLIASTFFFIEPSEKRLSSKKNVLSGLNSVLFDVLSIKLNKKIYSVSQLKHMTSFSYKTNMSVMYQFLLTNLKSPYHISKKD